MRRLATLLLGLLLLAPAAAQAQVLAYPSGVAGLTVNNCATTNRLLYLSSTGVTGCSTLSYDGTDITLASGQLILTENGTTIVLKGSTGRGIFMNGPIYGLSDGTPMIAWSFGNFSQIMRAAGGFLWSSTTDPTIAPDLGINRNAAGVVEINSGTAGTFRDLILRSLSLNSATVSGSSPGITVGSGTGVTVNYAADLRRVIYKVTVTYAALAAAATTADKVIASLPAGTRLVGIVADTTTKYIGGAVSAATLIVGKTTGGNEYIVSHDVFAAAITRGLADAELGTSINRANAIQGGDLPSWTAATDISVRLTTTSANTDALTQGSTTYYLTTEAK